MKRLFSFKKSFMNGSLQKQQQKEPQNQIGHLDFTDS